MQIDLAADSGYAFRLVVASVLGALLGLEREIHEHPAGMRTHLLVSLGSGGFTVLSIGAFPAPGADPARIAAQIVAGIGFLGAGAILKEGATIRGLTTASSLWVAAAIGMAAGAGALVVAITVTAIAIISLWPLRLVTERVIDRERHRVRLRLFAADPAVIARLVSVIGAQHGTIAQLATKGAGGDRLEIDLEVHTKDVESGAALTAAVVATEGIEIGESQAVGD
jgi:putative Mg2+ transporter-C (MgtC) family protein